MAGEVGTFSRWAATVFDGLDLQELSGQGPVSKEECQKAVERRFPIATQPLAHSFVSKVSLVIGDVAYSFNSQFSLVSCFPGSNTRASDGKSSLKTPVAETSCVDEDCRWVKHSAGVLRTLLTIPQEKLSLSIFRAAKSMQESLLDKKESYYLNIGMGPCRELKVLM